jgi:hypothetical protein
MRDNDITRAGALLCLIAAIAILSRELWRWKRDDILREIFCWCIAIASAIVGYSRQEMFYSTDAFLEIANEKSGKKDEQ